MPTTDIMALPWASVLFFAAGYAGYFVANSGIRDHHKQIDTAFSTAVFGFFSLLIYIPLQKLEIGNYYASMPAFVGALCVGAVWRKYGRSRFEKTLRDLGISLVNDVPSAWQEMLEKRGVEGTQLSVLLKDGTEYCCDELHKFCEAPNGPCILGGNGDVLFYPTDKKIAGAKDWTTLENDPHDWGLEAYWIPAGEIKIIKYRRAVIS